LITFEQSDAFDIETSRNNHCMILHAEIVLPSDAVSIELHDAGSSRRGAFAYEIDHLQPQSAFA
jgi:hypothetical protein